MDFQHFPFLRGDGEMIAKVARHDWEKNPLGEPSDWPDELVVAASLVLESRFPQALIWGPEMVTIYNDAFHPILGSKAEALGRSFGDVWSEAWDVIGPIVQRAYEGEATFIEDFPLAINRNGEEELAYFTFCYSPVRYGDGSVAGMIDTVVETTAQVQARERSRFVNDELGHRLKNTLAIVQAIGRQSLKKVTERDLVEAFHDRITALSQANEILLQASWQATPIRKIVSTMLEAHGSEHRINISGENFPLGPKAALSLSMLLHELATNAVKYGSLGPEGGCVDLEWHSEGEDFVLRWRESQGPPVREPTGKGFGSRIIELGLLGTRNATIRYLNSGLDAEFRAPLSRLPET